MPVSAMPAVAVNEDTSFLARIVGIASSARDHRDCLTIANGALETGATLLVVSPRLPQRVDSAVVVAKRDRPCTEYNDEWGHATINNPSYYNIQLTDSVELGGPAIVLATRNAALLVQGSTVQVDLDGDANPERFEECTSREGTHYFVFTGNVRRWHAYYYVPYDLESNCRESLFTGDSG